MQLPNFGAPDSVPPAQPAWAIQRESMDAALSLPNTGERSRSTSATRTTSIPRNKQDVGIRLALVARARRVRREASSRRDRRIARTRFVGDTVVVEFANVGGGLTTTRADGRVGGFALAGADGRFVWADARDRRQPREGVEQRRRQARRRAIRVGEQSEHGESLQQRATPGGAVQNGSSLTSTWRGEQREIHGIRHHAIAVLVRVQVIATVHR